VEGERLQVDEPEVAAGQGVVAKLGMPVQGKMVGEEAHLAADQLRDPAELVAGEDSRRPVPEEPVMDQDRVRPGLPGLHEQLMAGGDAHYDFADFVLALDLQTVRAVVAAVGGVQVLIEVGDELVAADHGRESK
jgi:hypothetical protein